MKGRLNSKYIRITAMADKMAVLVSLVIIALREDALVLVEISDIKNNSFHPDCTVGHGI